MHNMRRIAIVLILLNIITSCKFNKTKESELELKEIELTQREREFELKRDSSINIVATNEVAKTEVSEKKEIAEEGLSLPFVGKRWFQIDNGANGRGTPRYFIEIYSNGDTYAGYTQVNQATGEETTEKILTGKYKSIIKAYFEEDQKYYFYTIEGNYIYELDENSQKYKGTYCCEFYDDKNPDKECDCRGILEK